MKTFICAIALILSLLSAKASTFKLDGDLTWEITEPRLTFKLNGDLQNLSPAGSISGTIKLGLWATKDPFPSSGEFVGEFTLGQISGRYQFSDFTVRTTVDLEDLSGPYHFTVVVMEFTTASWRNVVAVPTGTRQLLNGDLVGQTKWLIPAGKAVTPPGKIRTGDVVVLRQRATGELNLFPANSRFKTTLDVKSSTSLVAKNRLGTRAATYQYAVVQGRFKNKKTKAGQLTLTYPPAGNKPRSTVPVTLYFQGPSSGTYKAVEPTTPGTETLWGTFSLQ